MDTNKITPKPSSWAEKTPSTNKADKAVKKEATKSDQKVDLFKSTNKTASKKSTISKLAENVDKAVKLVNPTAGFVEKLKLGVDAGRIVADSVKEYKKDSGGIVEGAKSFAKDTVSIFKQLVDDDKKAESGGKTAKDAKPKEDDTLEKIWSVISKSKSVTDAVDKVGDLGRKQVLDEFKEVAIPTIKDWLGFGEKTAEKAVGKTGELVDDVATVASKGAGIGAEAGSLLSKLPGLAGKALGAFGAAYSAYSIYKNFGKLSLSDGALNGAAVGAFAGSFLGPVGITVGGIAGGVVGGALSFFKGDGKDKDQKARDEMRSGLQKMGMVDDSFNLTLADGSKYDISKDGKSSLKNIDGSERRVFDVDLADERAGEVVGWINPLADAMAGENEKVKTDLVGYLTNAALSNSSTRDDARANVMKFYEDSKVDVVDLATAVDAGMQAGKVKPGLGEAYLNGLSYLYTS